MRFSETETKAVFKASVNLCVTLCNNPKTFVTRRITENTQRITENKIL